MFGGARLPGRLLAMLGGDRLAAARLVCVLVGGVRGVEEPRGPVELGASDRLRGVPAPGGGRASPGGGGGMWGRPPPPDDTTPETHNTSQ
jgi:hypothetical protein